MTKTLCSKASPSSNCIMNRMYLRKCEKLGWNGKGGRKEKKKNIYNLFQFSVLKISIWNLVRPMV